MSEQSILGALKPPLLGFLIPLACLAAEEPNQASLRHAALDDLFVLRDYRAGKNSFVESPERHPGAWTGTGYRHTVADLHGQGSVRHIWTTRGEGEPFLDWEFFVDGESEPSIRGTAEELVEAAGKVTEPVAPANYIPIDRRACNFFLPVPFDKSLRIDVVQRLPTFWLWFAQIDYRLRDASMAGARLRMENGKLAYHRLPEKKAHPTGQPPVTRNIPPLEISPGQPAFLALAEGPAILRELRLTWSSGADLQLRIRYDGAETSAVNAPVHRFFGPFKGASFFQHAPNDASCYLPMPFRKNCEIVIRNVGQQPASVSCKAVLEPVPVFPPGWGYFHALHQRTDKTNGHRLHQVLSLRGRGHWVGMSLFGTGHDHGGGDFAVIDGEGDNPAFLHGINGEDYFTFAWFGKGAHPPYAVALSNEEGRYRHHFENVYPFRKSLAIDWGAFPDLSPESVAVWYQDRPENTTLPDGARAESAEWNVFGPVPIPPGTTDPFSVLPSVADLDAGKEFECRLVRERFTSSWMKEWSTGPALNLTYIGRHKTKIVGEVELGGTGHAFLARRFLESDREQSMAFRFAHDDPTELWLNGQHVYAGPDRPNGFETVPLTLPLRKGRNELLVRLTNSFNRDFNWAGFLLR